VGWNHNLIDPTAFREAYNAFFSTPSDKRHAPFIALLLAVLCVGLGNMTPERAIRENICKDQAHWKRRCGAYWRASQRALGANDIARSKPIELAQTLVMLLYCNQSLDDNGYAKALPHTLNSDDSLISYCIVGNTLPILWHSLSELDIVWASQSWARRPLVMCPHPVCASENSEGACGGILSFWIGTCLRASVIPISSIPHNVTRPFPLTWTGKK
jgi:hypothetical protein